MDSDDCAVAVAINDNSYVADLPPSSTHLYSCYVSLRCLLGYSKLGLVVRRPASGLSNGPSC
jgi:hypothetical protein